MNSISKKADEAIYTMAAIVWCGWLALIGFCGWWVARRQTRQRSLA